MNTHTPGHCHGCGHLTPSAVCRHCGFENNKIHEVREEGDSVYRFLVCCDCGEHVRAAIAKATGVQQ